MAKRTTSTSRSSSSRSLASSGGRTPKIKIGNEAIAVIVMGGVAVDGGGFVIYANGKIGRVPPRGPLTEGVRSLSAAMAGAARGRTAG